MINKIKKFGLVKQSLLVFLCVSLFSMGFSIQFYQNGQMDLKIAAASSASSNVKPVLVWDTLEYTFSARLGKDLYTKLVLDLNNSVFQSMVQNAYVQFADIRVGKQLIPFGSYISRSISGTFSKTFEETIRMAATYKMNYQDVFITYISAFNNSKGDAMTGLAGKFVVIPRPEIKFAVSGLFDQEYDGSLNSVSKFDVHGMAELNFNEAIVDMEFYRCLSGMYKNALVFNGGLTVIITDTVDMAFRFEGTNATGAAVLGKKAMFSGGINFKVDQNFSYSLEGSYVTLASSKESIEVATKLALSF